MQDNEDDRPRCKHNRLFCGECHTDNSKSATNELLCVDCGFEIKPPLGKPFDCGDGKIRCAGCAVDRYMTMPYSSIARFNIDKKSVFDYSGA